MFYNYNELFLENEVWKDCVDWEEFYEISNFGRVKSKERKLFYEGGTVARKITEKIRKPKLNKHTGYLMVGLNGKGKSQNVTVHSLVSKAFIENYESFGIGRGKCTNHKDGNKLNNNLENLEVINLAYTVRHMFNNGLTTSNHRLEFEEKIYNSKAKFREQTGISEKKMKKMIEQGFIKVL